VKVKTSQNAQGTRIMTAIRALFARLLPAAPQYADIAVGNMTDSHLRRTGLSKAEILHRTFSGLSTCN